MGVYYKFINPETLKVVNEAKFAGLEILYSPRIELESKYGTIQCALKYDYKNHIYTEYTLDKNSDLYKEYYPTSIYEQNYESAEYITRECAIKMQKDMEVNETIFTDSMDDNNCDALIVEIS